MNNKFEYFRFSCYDKDLIDKLDKYGSDGWDFVNIIKSTNVIYQGNSTIEHDILLKKIK